MEHGKQKLVRSIKAIDTHIFRLLVIQKPLERKKIRRLIKFLEIYIYMYRLSYRSKDFVI